MSNIPESWHRYAVCIRFETLIFLQEEYSIPTTDSHGYLLLFSCRIHSLNKTFMVLRYGCRYFYIAKVIFGITKTMMTRRNRLVIKNYFRNLFSFDFSNKGPGIEVFCCSFVYGYYYLILCLKPWINS